MNGNPSKTRIATTALALAILALWSVGAGAYQTYSQNRDATNCRMCHGDYRAPNYISLSDGMNWGNLHDLHRNVMLNGDCTICHQTAAFFPVEINDADGGQGMESISCLGCHGRAEDNTPANPEFNDGYGAGLRQHHWNSGIGVCQNCHQDANPAAYTPVGEDVLPPYYLNPGVGHPNIPNDPCNSDGSENFAGLPEGLDNDGDNLYDGNDPDCGGGQGCRLNCPAGDGGITNPAGSGNKSPDINGDGVVDIVDFAQFGAAFLSSDYCADFDCDGTVNIVDFAHFGAHFLHGPGVPGVCE